ncbi:MAG: oxygen-independent coproporphyrinogen-3 oxidase [bacterium]|jgi:oxygen-independent coproporphyrinogen-3 oxidase
MDIPALYIHIPFCQKVCPFCAFAVLKDKTEKHIPYIQALKKEISLYQQQQIIQQQTVQSVYFGGGTPSCLSIPEVQEILTSIKQAFQFKEDTQWSIEINPEDAQLSYLQELKGLGFNRVSLGIQSFHDASLKNLGRVHNAKTAHHAVENIQKAGFSNFNLDFMFGHLGQSFQDLKKDFQTFLDYSPTHLSTYCLNIEEKTQLAKKQEWSLWQEDHEALISEMYVWIIESLKEHQIFQYEVSNFAKKGYESQQNLFNWNGKNYLGLGAGAHSFLRPQRWSNERQLKKYQESIAQQHFPRDFEESLTIEQMEDEFLMVQLRRIEGVYWNGFQNQQKAKQKLSKKISQLEKMEWIKQNSESFSLTSKGLLLADEIAVDLASCLSD